MQRQTPVCPIFNNNVINVNEGNYICGIFCTLPGVVLFCGAGVTKLIQITNTKVMAI